MSRFGCGTNFFVDEAVGLAEPAKGCALNMPMRTALGWLAVSLGALRAPKSREMPAAGIWIDGARAE